MYYHNGRVINSYTRLGNNLCHYFTTGQAVYPPKLKGKHPTLEAIDLIQVIGHNTCLASQYRRNKASGLSHTHLNTNLKQATTVIHSTNFSGVGGGGIRHFMLAGPNKSDCNFISGAINEREFM